METKQKTEKEIEVENYVLNRPLIRPEINVVKVLRNILIFCLCVFGLTTMIFFFCTKGLESIMTNIIKLVNSNQTKLFIIILTIVGCIAFLLCLKPIAIGLVHLYQHYSPEKLRRNCLFKPTCSEYAILAIKKYGLIEGCIKTKQRLDKCHGDEYREDYP